MAVAGGTRLCWNCDGDIDIELSRCPYCGADPEAAHGHDLDEEQDFSPPYRMEDVAAKERLLQERPPYSGADEGGIDDETWEQSLSPEQDEECRRQNRETLLADAIPLALLLSGAVFCLFGLVLFLYSGQGRLVLEWNTSHWPVYLVPAVVMLYYGWKRLSETDSD